MASVESLRPLPPPSPDEPPRLTARTLGGLEEVLAAELLRLGAGDLRIGRRTIEFSGSTETLYRAVLECTRAHRVLPPGCRAPPALRHRVHADPPLTPHVRILVSSYQGKVT